MKNDILINGYKNKWLAFIGIALLSFGAYLDYTVVNVALPTIEQDLKTNLTSLQWVMNIYFLALCILATIMGRCGDLFGRRKCFYMGVGIFGIASLIAGLAPDINWLIFGRFLQGVGAAIVFPLGLSLLPESFPEDERAKAIALLGSMGGIALALGPVLGGFIVAHWGWRWIFFINIPIIFLGYVFCYSSVKESISTERDISLDWKGMVLLALTMGGIVLSLIHSHTAGWANLVTQAYLVTGLISGFLLVKMENAQENPLIDFADFKNSLFYSGAMLMLLAGTLSAVALFFDPLYLQIILGQSPQFSGMVLFAIPVAVFLGAFLVDKTISHIGIMNTILSGMLISCIAALMQIFFTENTSLFYIVIAFLLLGSMWALGNTVPIIAAQTAVGAARSGVATGTMVTMFNVGGSIGLAIAVVIYNYASEKSLQMNQAGNLSELVANPSHAIQTQMDTVTHTLFNTAFMHGFSGAMWFLLGLSLLVLASILGWMTARR